MTLEFHDSFTETVDTLLSAHSADVGGPGYSVAPWSGASTISCIGTAGLAKGSSSASSAMYTHSKVLSSRAVKATLVFRTISTSNEIHGVQLHIAPDGTKTFYNLVYNSTELKIEKWVNGVFTAFVTPYVFTPVTGVDHTYVWTITEESPATLRHVVTYDGTEVINDVDTSPIANPGSVGVVSRLQGYLVDLKVESLGEPPPQGVVTIESVTPGETSAVTTYTYSAADHTGFEYRLNAGSSSALDASPATIVGLTAETGYDLQIRAISLSGAGEWSSVASFTTSAAGTSTITLTEPLKNNTGAILANETGIKIGVLEPGTLASVFETVLATDASGMLEPISNPFIVSGQSYHVVIKIANGGVGITGALVAS